jgi:hypothetical protein
MFRLLPHINHDMNKTSAEINLRVTKSKKEKWFVNCATPKIKLVHIKTWFTVLLY